MPIFFAREVGRPDDPGRRLGEDDAREVGVDGEDVADRDPLAHGRDDARPVGDADVDRALADERDELRVDLVLERDLEAGVAVVAGLVGEVELGELDARDVAEADGELDGAAGVGEGVAGCPWRRARSASGRRGVDARRRRRRRDGEAAQEQPGARRPPRPGAAPVRWSRWSRVSPVLAVRPRGETARGGARSGARPSPSLIRTLTVGPAGATRDGRGRVCDVAAWRPSLVGSPRSGALPPVGNCTLPRRRDDRSTGVSGDGPPAASPRCRSALPQVRAATWRSTSRTEP